MYTTFFYLLNIYTFIPPKHTNSVLFVPQVIHKASTRERHCCRFVACLVMVSQVSLHAFISVSTVLSQVSLGRLLFRFPSCVQCKAILGSASDGIRRKYPSHLHLLFSNLGKRCTVHIVNIVNGKPIIAKYQVNPPTSNFVLLFLQSP